MIVVNVLHCLQSPFVLTGSHDTTARQSRCCVRFAGEGPRLKDRSPVVLSSGCTVELCGRAFKDTEAWGIWVAEG